MNARLADLLAEAQGQISDLRPNWIQYAPIVRTLREKGWGYQRIYDWLTSKGEPLPQERFTDFRAAMSMAAGRLRKSTERAAAKP